MKAGKIVLPAQLQDETPQGNKKEQPSVGNRIYRTGSKGGTVLKTIIELYDKEPVENVLSACIFAPDMVVYLCDTRDTTLRKEQAVSRLLKSRGLKTKTRFYYVDTRSISLIRRVLDAVVQDYPGCVFDFSGGADLVLMTAAVYCAERHIRAFFIDVERGKFINLRGCEQLAFRFTMPSFSVEDIFAITGMRAVGNGHFPLAQLTDDFVSDAKHIWEQILEDPDDWNAAAGFFQAVGAQLGPDELWVDVPRVLRSGRYHAVCPEGPVQFLARNGILRNFSMTRDRVRFRYKTGMMKKNLQNHGLWLELYLYFELRDSGLFDDVRTSVLVEWDTGGDSRSHTRNEIDVMAIRGVTPIFISCKMGAPTPLALSEIRLLGEKMGGGYAQTVLLTAAPVRMQSPSIARRAEDLGLVLLDRADVQNGNLAKRIAQLVRTTNN